MKRKTFYVLLGCEAVLCIFFHLVRVSLPIPFSNSLAFPFAELSMGLRILSLSGAMGNIAALILYSAICLLPLGGFFFIKHKRKRNKEDFLLVLLSLLLFVGLYWMINPGRMSVYLGQTAAQGGGSALLGSIFYSVIVGYILLRILRHFLSADIGRLHKSLLGLLYGIQILLVFSVFGAGFAELIESFQVLQSSNAGNVSELGLSHLFLILQYGVDSLPYALDIWIVFSAMQLLQELIVDQYSKASVSSAQALSAICVLALKMTVLVNIGFNLLQLLFIKGLSVVSTSVPIPLLSIAFVLMVLLLAQYAKENKSLKDDNDMFI